jgi:hypothetical protein
MMGSSRNWRKYQEQLRTFKNSRRKSGVSESSIESLDKRTLDSGT